MDDTILGPDWPPKLKEDELPLVVDTVCGDGKRKTWELSYHFVRYFFDEINPRFKFDDYNITIDNPPLGLNEKVAIVYETDYL